MKMRLRPVPQVECVYRITANDLPLDHKLIGGKALGLRKIYDAGCPTLPSVVVTAAIFEELADELAVNPDASEIDGHLARGDEQSAFQISSRLRDRIESYRFSENHMSRFLSATHELTGDSDYITFAVRSSGSSEDQHDHSFAGCFASFLNVSTDNLAPAILACYASLYSRSSLLYSVKNNIPIITLSMAIVLQPAVPARAAGVGFSTDPRSGSISTSIIEASPGLGTTLVSGQV